MKEPEQPSEFDPKTFRNKHGNYPVWMSKKKQHEFAKKNRKAKKKLKKGKKN